MEFYRTPRTQNILQKRWESWILHHLMHTLHPYLGTVTFWSLIILSTLRVAFFVKKCFDSNAFSILAESFKLASATHKYNTGSARNGLLFVTSYNSVTFGRKSIHSTALIRNYLHDKLVVYDFLILTPKSFKSLSSNVFISTYDS